MSLWSHSFSQNVNQIYFCPVLCHTTGQKSLQFLVHIWNDDFINSFWNLLTFRSHRPTNNKSIHFSPYLQAWPSKPILQNSWLNLTYALIWASALGTLRVLLWTYEWILDAVGSSEIFFPTQNLERALHIGCISQ